MDIDKVLHKLDGKKAKVTRSLSLDEDNYERLVKLCEDRGWKMSTVIDALLEEFLAGVGTKKKR